MRRLDLRQLNLPLMSPIVRKKLPPVAETVCSLQELRSVIRMRTISGRFGFVNLENRNSPLHNDGFISLSAR